MALTNGPMSYTIAFTWKGKEFTAHVEKEHFNSGVVWFVEVVHGDSYLLTKVGERWQCSELDEKLCSRIGEAIEAKDIYA